MSNDPKRGVVDRDGKVHGLAHLYVAGSSVFPSSGHANPTLTIVAPWRSTSPSTWVAGRSDPRNARLA
jgi:hypothetical protein